MNAVAEKACQFGPTGQLSGILAEPASGEPQEVWVLITAGLLPKFGPFRLYAELARRLASQGIAVLRFDLGGIGESGQEFPGMPLRERTCREIAEAVALVRGRYRLNDVTLFGLCSGAEDSFRFAESDSRVARVVMIDPFAYRTPGWGWRHLLHRVKRRGLRLLGLYTPLSTADSGGLVNYQYMGREESGRILKTLVARGTRVHFIYTGGMHEVFNHRRQLRAMFAEIDFAGRVALNHFPEMDHTAVLREDRDRVVDAIVSAWR